MIDVYTLIHFMSSTFVAFIYLSDAVRTVAPDDHHINIIFI